MPSFKIIGLLFLEKKILKVYAIYSHGGHLGHVTLTMTIYTNFDLDHLYKLSFPRPNDAPHKSFDWQSGFREEDV